MTVQWVLPIVADAVTAVDAVTFRYAPAMYWASDPASRSNRPVKPPPHEIDPPPALP
jgi:hypothetical protein